MRIAIDLANYRPAWGIAGGALEYAGSARDIAILLPHAPMSRADDCDPDTWDGAIVLMPRPDLDLPQVSVSSAYRGEGVSVSINYGEVVKLAIDQFAAMGLADLAFFSLKNWLLGWNSFSGQVKKLDSNPVFISAEEPEQALINIRKPCGVLAFNDELGLQLLQACKALGLRVPGDVHIISIGDTPASMRSTPTLSSIAMPLELVGFHAVELCAKMIHGDPVKSLKIPPSGLIIRDSIKVENDDIKTAAEIAHYLRTSLSHPIQMEDIVRRSSISRRKLEGVFRSAYGASPMAYFKELRLDHAKEMLRTSDAELKDIAKECGYRDSNHLCRTFRERVGLTPLRYRETQAGAKGSSDT